MLSPKIATAKSLQKRFFVTSIFRHQNNVSSEQVLSALMPSNLTNISHQSCNGKETSYGSRKAWISQDIDIMGKQVSASSTREFLTGNMNDNPSEKPAFYIQKRKLSRKWKSSYYFNTQHLKNLFLVKCTTSCTCQTTLAVSSFAFLKSGTSFPKTWRILGVQKHTRHLKYFLKQIQQFKCKFHVTIYTDVISRKTSMCKRCFNIHMKAHLVSD